MMAGSLSPRRTSSCRDQEAQERADADRYALHALDRYGLRTFDHVCPDRHGVVGRRDIPQRIDEGSNRPKIRGERRFSQAALLAGPSRKLRHQWRRRFRRQSRHHALILKVGDEQLGALDRVLVEVAAEARPMSRFDQGE